jgi:hypothetical protein
MNPNRSRAQLLAIAAPLTLFLLSPAGAARLQDPPQTVVFRGEKGTVVDLLTGAPMPATEVGEFVAGLNFQSDLTDPSTGDFILGELRAYWRCLEGGQALVGYPVSPGGWMGFEEANQIDLVAFDRVSGKGRVVVHVPLGGRVAHSDLRRPKVDEDSDEIELSLAWASEAAFGPGGEPLSPKGGVLVSVNPFLPDFWVGIVESPGVAVGDSGVGATLLLIDSGYPSGSVHSFELNVVPSDAAVLSVENLEIIDDEDQIVGQLFTVSVLKPVSFRIQATLDGTVVAVSELYKPRNANLVEVDPATGSPAGDHGGVPPVEGGSGRGCKSGTSITYSRTGQFAYCKLPCVPSYTEPPPSLDCVADHGAPRGLYWAGECYTKDGYKCYPIDGTYASPQFRFVEQDQAVPCGTTTTGGSWGVSVGIPYTPLNASKEWVDWETKDYITACCRYQKDDTLPGFTFSGSDCLEVKD